MTKEQFNTITSGCLVQPKYDGYSDKGFNVLTINSREGLIEINQVRYMSKSEWYRYENLDIVTYKKVIDKNTFEEKENYEHI